MSRVELLHTPVSVHAGCSFGGGVRGRLGTMVAPRVVVLVTAQEKQAAALETTDAGATTEVGWKRDS
jgi:hypothetical protein